MLNLIRQPRFFVPLLIFAAIAAFFAAGLKLDSRLVPSPLIGKSAPDTELPLLSSPSVQFNSEQMQGRAWVLNVWASWCAACREEHEILMRMEREGMPIVGLNYKDKPIDARRWLRDWGDPYLLTAVDQDGDEALDWGVYGVPETFVIDSRGIIQYKHIGPLADDVVSETIRPILHRGQGG